MGETETDKQHEDGADKTVEEETDASKNQDGAEDDTEEGADSDDNNDDSATDEEETDDDEDETDDKKSKKSTSKDEDGEEDKEPPTRKRPSDFARERIERKNAKNGKGKEAKATQTEDDEDEDDVDPADKETIGKVVAKALKPFIEKEAREQDDREVSTFLTENPDFKPYEAKARKYMSHPSRKDVPIEEIFYGVAGKDLLKIGAKRAKIANDEAKKTKSAGGSADAGGVKTNASLSREELAEKQAQVRSKMADRY